MSACRPELGPDRARFLRQERALGRSVRGLALVSAPRGRTPAAVKGAGSVRERCGPLTARTSGASSRREGQTAISRGIVTRNPTAARLLLPQDIEWIDARGAARRHIRGE